MLRLIHRIAKPFIAALLMACMFSWSAPRAAAADGPSDVAKRAETVASPGTSSGGNSGKDVRSAPQVLYAAFSTPMIVAAEPTPEPATRPRRVSDVVPSVKSNTAPPLPVPRQPTVVSFAPMTAGEKFEAWFHSRFLSFGAYGSAVANGLWKELQDNDDFKKDTVSNYFADSMTRAARSYAFGTTAGFFEKALFASLFRQDPRYHRSGKTGAGGRIGYAVSRVFVTQGDRCGCQQVNASFLLGGAAATGVSTLWERSERTGPRHTISRYYNHIAITALFNIVKEFVSGQ